MSPIPGIVINASTHGSSPTAFFIESEYGSGHRHLQSAFSLGKGMEAAYNELDLTLAECHLPNWDGYDAAPVNWLSYEQAKYFLHALSLGTPPPSVGAHPDGHIAFEWYKSPSRVLSVSVGPDGTLYYAGLLGDGKIHGNQTFSDEIPSIITNLIQLVYLP